MSALIKTDSKMIPIEEIMIAHQRLSTVVHQTPFLQNYNLSTKYGCDVFLKREDMQVVRSFKIRGAYNKMASLDQEILSQGVVCASAGNHAQGVAFACSKLNVKGVIFMPSTTPNQKITKVKHFGGDNIEVILIGDTFDDAHVAAREYEQKNKSIFIHPFDDRDVIAGQGTVALEMLHGFDHTLDYVFVAVGGGGLISGVGSYFKAICPQTKIVAVEAEGAPALHNSLTIGSRISLDKIDHFADGIAVRDIGKLTFEIAQEVVDETVLVPEGKICSAILDLYNDEAIVVEPAGAVSIAALDLYKDKIKGKKVGVIICGGNNDITRTEEIRERALLYEGLKQYFIIRFPQRAGALREFLDVLGPDDDIAHFEYTKKNSRNAGPALVGIELKQKEDYDGLIERMQKASINFQPINENPMLFEMLI